MPQRIPTVPRSEVPNVVPWLEMAEFIVPLDNITSTFSTGEYVMEYLPEDVMLTAIGYRVITRFIESSEEVWPTIWFGSTGDPKAFGSLSAAQLCSTLAFGEIPINFQDTSTGAGLPALAAHLHYGGLTGATVAAGEVELWLKYRSNSQRSAKRGVRAK